MFAISCFSAIRNLKAYHSENSEFSFNKKHGENCTNGRVKACIVICLYCLQCNIPSPYSSPHLILERMEELIERTSLEESGWRQRERWFKLPVLCSGMVGFFLSYFIQFCNNCHHLGPFILLYPPFSLRLDVVSCTFSVLLDSKFHNINIWNYVILQKQNLFSALCKVL